MLTLGGDLYHQFLVRYTGILAGLRSVLVPPETIRLAAEHGFNLPDDADMLVDMAQV